MRPPSPAAEKRRAGDVIPVVHVSVPVVVATHVTPPQPNRRASSPPARTGPGCIRLIDKTRPGARLGAAADDQLAVVEHVARLKLP